MKIQIIINEKNRGCYKEYENPKDAIDFIESLIQEKTVNVNTKWDELSYDEKENLRVKRPALWKKLYREKYGTNP